VDAFQRAVDGGAFKNITSNLQARSSRHLSLIKWAKFREENPSMLESDIKKLQRAEAAAKKKNGRQVRRLKGLTSKGRLFEKWRVLEMGDKEDTWKKKLSFIPMAEIKHFGQENLMRLQQLQDRLVEVVRLRGGARAATKTNKHQKGQSFGMTVAPGG